MSSSHPPPPDIKFETTHGGLPVIKLDFDERTPAEIDSERCVLRLKASNGTDVVLIGTAHVSLDSAETTERVIREEKPEIVFIELDKKRLEKLLQNRSLGERRVLKNAIDKIRDIPSAFSFAASNLREVPGFIYQIGGLIVGSPAGNEFTKAVESASSIGALVILGDRSAEVTASRVMNRVRFGTREKSGRKKETRTRVKKLDPEERVRDVATRYGCEDPGKVLKCLKRILSAGMNVPLPPGEADDEEREMEVDLNERDGENSSSFASTSGTKKINANDLKVVRECARKIIEATRKEGFDGEGAFSSVLLDASNSETEKDVRRTILDERDVILAHSLHKAAKQAGPNVRKIVGVVGSGHVPGIKKIFTRLNDTSKRSEGDVLLSSLEKEEERHAHDEYLNAFPRDVDVPDPALDMARFAVMLGGFTYLNYKKPAVARRVSAVFLGGMSVVAIGAANILVKVGQFAEKLDDASHELRMREKVPSRDADDNARVMRTARIRNGVRKYDDTAREDEL
jgi:pheromone shutdown protein TraB